MSGPGYAQAVAPLPLSPTLLARCSVVAIDPNLGQAATQAALDAAGAGCAVVAMDFEREPDVVRACRILVASRERLLRQQEKRTRSIRSTWPGGWWKRAARPRESSRWAGRLRRRGPQRRFVARPAVRPPRVVDTTGAGDTFRAGLCYGLLQRWPLRQTVRFASAAAALHCAEWGGGSRIPLARVLEFACG
jgi:sugar/nucleoside kinase (ribokinase family)